MGARTRGDEVVKPPKGFSNHLWPPKRVNFQNFSYIFFKNLQNFSTYFFLNFFENINILAIFRLTTSSFKIPPLKKKKKVFNFTKNLDAWNFLWHLTTSHPVGWKDFGANDHLASCQCCLIILLSDQVLGREFVIGNLYKNLYIWTRSTSFECDL